MGGLTGEANASAAWRILHEVQDGNDNDDEGRQLHDHDPASKALLAQAESEDDHRDADDQQEQRGHVLECACTTLRALGGIGGPHATQASLSLPVGDGKLPTGCRESGEEFHHPSHRRMLPVLDLHPML
jgi:hypothetical protein